jgi:hypothetical protein
MITREYEITPLENGYLVEHSYKLPTDINNEFNYKYKKYMFADWNGVVDWIKNNPIVIPQEI